MATAWDQFEAVDSKAPDWSEFEPVQPTQEEAAKALPLAVTAPLELTNQLMGTLGAGAIPSEMGRQQDQAEFEASRGLRLSPPKVAAATAGFEPVFGGPPERPTIGSKIQETPWLRDLLSSEFPYETRQAATGRDIATTPLEALQFGSRNVLLPLAKPENLALIAATQGTGLLGDAAPIVERAIAGYFGVEAGRAVVDAMPQLAKAESNSERLQILTEILGSGTIAALAGMHAVKPGADLPAPRLQPFVDRSVQGPPAAGDVLQGPRGAAMPRLELPESGAATPEQAAEQLRQMQREATTTFEQGRAPRPEVPEGPSDPRVTEIADKGLRTINQILDEYPELKGSREAARELRNQAFPELRKVPDAQRVREDQGLPGQAGPADEGGQADRSDDLQQTPPGQSEPVGEGKEGQTQVPEEGLDIEELVTRPAGAVDVATISGMTPEQTNAYFNGRRAAGVAAQYDAVKHGMQLGPEALPELEQLRDASGKAMQEAIKAGDQNKFQAEFGKNVWYSGAIEGVKKAGPNYEQVIKQEGAPKPPAPPEPPAEGAAPVPVKPTPTPPTAPEGQLLDVPQTARTPEAKRARIIKLLEQFEDEDPITGKVSLKGDLTEAQEKAAKKLRAMLGDIEKEKIPQKEPPGETKTISRSEHQKEQNFQKWFHQNAETLNAIWLERERAGTTQAKTLEDFGREMYSEKLKPVSTSAPSSEAPKMDRQAAFQKKIQEERQAYLDWTTKLSEKLPFESPGTVTLKNGSKMIVSRNIGKEPWRVSDFLPDGTPRGHMVFGSWAEVQRHLWGFKDDIADIKQGKPVRSAPAPAAPAVTKPGTKVTPKLTDEQAQQMIAEQKRLTELRDAKAAQVESLVNEDRKAGTMKNRDQALKLEGEVRMLNQEISKLAGAIFDWKLDKEFAPFRGQKEPEPTPPKITGKVLQTQKEHLQAAVSQALKEAPESGTDKITIQVPGDGEWSIFNNKQALKDFQEIVKTFPKGVSGESGPKLPSVKSRTMPKAVAPADADLPKLVGDFVSTDPDREPIQTAYADGQQIVATDGRQLLRIVTDKAPGSLSEPVRLDAKGKPAESTSNFPNFNQIISDNPDRIAGKVKTDQLWTLTNQAKQLTKGTDKVPSMELYLNPDGTLGARASEPSIGSFESNVQQGALKIGNFNADYIFNAADVARRLGNEKVDLYRHNPGVLEVRGKNHSTVTMGMRLENKALEDDVSKFPPSQAEHGPLTKGLGPIENPESLRSRVVDQGGQKYNVSIEGGRLTIEKKLPAGKGTFGQHTADRWDSIVNMPLEGATASEIRKASGGKLTGPVNEIIDTLRSLKNERERAVEALKERGKAAEEQGLAKKVSDALEGQAQAALDRIKKRRGGTTFGSGPLHELPNIRDYAIFGAAKLAKFGIDKAAFAAEMVREFGERIRPHLDRLFEEAKLILASTTRVTKARETPVQQIIGEATGASAAKPTTISQVVDTLRSGLKTVRALKDHFTGAPKISRAEVKMADDFLEADANRIRESLTDLVKKSLPLDERGRFITAINNATKRSPILTGDPEAMYRRAAEVAGRIENRAEEVRKADAIADIKRTIDRALKSPGVDVAFKQQIRAIAEGVTMQTPSAETLRKLRATQAYLAREAAAGRDVEIPQRVLDTLEVLHKTPIRELPLHVVEEMGNRLKLLEELGRMKVELRAQRWEAEKNAKIRELNNEDANPIDKRPEFRAGIGDPTPVSFKIRNWLNKNLDAAALLDKALLPVDALFDLLGDAKGKYEGWLFKHVRNPLDLDFNQAQVHRDSMTAPVERIIKEHDLGEGNAQRIAVHAYAEQGPQGMDHLVWTLGDTAKLESKDPRVSEAERARVIQEIRRISNSLTPQELSAYRAMREELDRSLPKLQKLMHQLYNIEVDPVDNYFPIQRDNRRFVRPVQEPPEPPFGTRSTFDELGGFKNLFSDFFRRTTKAEQGMTIQRVPGAQMPIRLNAFDTFYQHANDVAYLLETQRDIKMIGEMATGDLFREKYGQVGQSMVLDWLDTVARQGQLGGFRRIPWMDELRKRTSAGVIGFRIASQFVHLSNIPLAVARTGLANYQAGLRAALSSEGREFLKQNFAETFARGGGEPAMVEAASSDLSVFGKQIVPKSVVRAGFSIARQIDQLNSQATVLGSYFRSLREKGMDPSNYLDQPVDKEAQAKAMVLARRAVASPLPKDVPMVLSRGAGLGGNVSLARSLMQFQNIFLDQWSNIRHDLARAGIVEKNPALAAKMFLALTAMVIAETGIRETVKAGIQSATGYQPKNEMPAEGKLFVEVARRFPFMGQILAGVLYGESGIPVLDSALAVPKNVYRGIKAKTPEGQQRAGIRAISGTAQLLGVPGASQAGEIIEKAAQ